MANAVWKHECHLKDIKSGQPYLQIFYGLIEAGKITILSPGEELIQAAYALAKQNAITLYDALFVSLAIKLGLSLRTFDKIQAQILEHETI